MLYTEFKIEKSKFDCGRWMYEMEMDEMKFIAVVLNRLVRDVDIWRLDIWSYVSLLLRCICWYVKLQIEVDLNTEEKHKEGKKN